MAHLKKTSDTLLIFNFDAILAPHMRQGVFPPDLREALAEVSKRFSVAILSGRTVDELKERLGFRPQYLIGDHGLEGLPSWNRALHQLRKIPQEWREQIEAHPENLPKRTGVFIENRRSSLALHYRATSRKHLARRELLKFVLSLKPVPRVTPGQCVLHLVPAEAPNRFHAMEELIRISHARHALLIGFDKSDPDFFFGLPQKSELAGPPPSDAKSNWGRWLERRDLLKFLSGLTRAKTKKKGGTRVPPFLDSKTPKSDQFFRRNV